MQNYLKWKINDDFMHEHLSSYLQHNLDTVKLMLIALITNLTNCCGIKYSTFLFVLTFYCNFYSSCLGFFFLSLGFCWVGVLGGWVLWILLGLLLFGFLFYLILYIEWALFMHLWFFLAKEGGVGHIRETSNLALRGGVP